VNLRQTAELAALVSANRQRLITDSKQPLTDEQLLEYQDQSSELISQWTDDLSGFQAAMTSIPELEQAEFWREVVSTIECLLVSEMLARVWGATLTAQDQHWNMLNAEPVARRVLIAHLKVRRQTLSLMVHANAQATCYLRPVDSFRRRVERWTDLLLGGLVPRYRVDDFAFDERQSREFGRDQIRWERQTAQGGVWKVILVGLRLAFPRHIPELELTQRQNDGVTRCILGSLPQGTFDETVANWAPGSEMSMLDTKNVP
jgi:hypothetical protein